MIASFGHLSGYDAGYYGYAWSRAIAEDMASMFRHSPDGFMDTKLGKRLRDQIYAPGSSRKVEDSIQAVLGRERSLQPYFESIGMTQQKVVEKKEKAAAAKGEPMEREVARERQHAAKKQKRLKTEQKKKTTILMEKERQ